MYYRYIGKQKLKLSALGLGCMVVSPFYGEVDEKEATSTIKYAYELGVNHFDTADLYGFGHSEELVGRSIKRFRENIVLCTKGGLVVDRNNEKPVPRGVNTTPAYIRKALENSLKRLKTDYIDLYYLHRIDPLTPIEDTILEMSRFIKEGKIKYIGLSEVSKDDLLRAHQVYPVTAVQSEYSLWFRNPENEILKVCQENDIGFIPFSPLGRGFLTGTIKNSLSLKEYDFRKNLPRFTEENIEKNISMVKKLTEIANLKNCTPAQLSLAWLLNKGDYIVPIPGTAQKKYLKENIAAINITLTKNDMGNLDEIFPLTGVAGGQFSDNAFKIFNSFAKDEAKKIVLNRE